MKWPAWPSVWGFCWLVVNEEKGMAFRRDREQALTWQRWIDEHYDQLVATSVPKEIYSDQFRWQRFLESGGWDAESGWHVEMLSQQQAQHLCSLVTGTSAQPDKSIIQAIRKVIDRRKEESS